MRKEPLIVLSFYELLVHCQTVVHHLTPLEGSEPVFIAGQWMWPYPRLPQVFHEIMKITPNFVIWCAGETTIMVEQWVYLQQTFDLPKPIAIWGVDKFEQNKKKLASLELLLEWARQYMVCFDTTSLLIEPVHQCFLARPWPAETHEIRLLPALEEALLDFSRKLQGHFVPFAPPAYLSAKVGQGQGQETRERYYGETEEERIARLELRRKHRRPRRRKVCGEDDDPGPDSRESNAFADGDFGGPEDPRAAQIRKKGPLKREDVLRNRKRMRPSSAQNQAPARKRRCGGWDRAAKIREVLGLDRHSNRREDQIPPSPIQEL